MTFEELYMCQVCTNLLEGFSDVVYKLEHSQMKQWVRLTSVLFLQVNGFMIEEFGHEH